METHSVLAEKVRLLSDRCELLEEENRQFREAMRGPVVFTFPREWELSTAETKTLSSLYTAPNGTRTTQALLVASSAYNVEIVGISVVQVRICTMRKKLHPYGIEINTIWAHGYELPAESRATISEALTAGAQA